MNKAQEHSKSPFKHAQAELMNYLNNLMAIHLKNPNRLPASEIFCFSDANAGKHHLRGSLRAAIHMGLNDPSIYLNVSRKNINDINLGDDNFMIVIISISFF